MESDSLQFKPEVKPVYRALAEHQVQEDDWELADVLAWFQLWSGRFVQECDLAVGEIALCVDWLPRNRLGHFRRGHNGFGLTAEIAINRRYLTFREPWECLGTLFHELLHAWQELHGKPGRNNYHNRQFREKARSYGLVIDTRGRTQYEPESRFFRLLRQYGVAVPEIPPVQYVLRGQPKLKKWMCRCDPPINARVAVAHFYARCLWCGELFRTPEAEECQP